MPTYRQVQYSFGGAFTPAVKALIIANVVIWFVTQPLWSTVVPWLALSPQSVLRGAVWQIVTYLFLHAGVFHLFFNMLALYFFGGPLESTWGTRRFVRFFLLTGVAAGVTVILAGFLAPVAFVVGASGAILGIIVAWAMLFPHQHAMLFPLPIPIRAPWFAAVMCGLDVAILWQQGFGAAGSVAHLGGALAGYLYFKVPRRRMGFDLARLNPLAAYRRWRNDRIARKFKVIVNEDFLSGSKRNPKSYLN